MKKELGIYIHIPFCVRKCLYCDFLSGPESLQTQEKYLNALCREIEDESSKYAEYLVKTVFIGGGTPSLLSGEWMKKLLGSVYGHYQVDENAEISVEVNPGTATEEKLVAYKEAGINRISIGIQSLNDEELKALGRIHDSRQFYETYQMCVKTGFNNINVDLMSAIPGQTLESWKSTLAGVVALTPAPTHISAYSLIVEEGTPFYENTPELPDEEAERDMYKITNDILEKKGYHRYEISNYAKQGYECEHNKSYWMRKNYVGFGIGAASLVNNVRFSNVRDLSTYLKKEMKKEECNRLSRQEQMEEFMFLGLRMMDGVSEKEFFEAFGESIEHAYPGIVEKYWAAGLLDYINKQGSTGFGEKADVRIALTEYGIDVSNVVMADFLLT